LVDFIAFFLFAPLTKRMLPSQLPYFHLR